MKPILIIMLSVAVVIAMLWIAIGGQALTIALGAMLVIIAVFLAFGAGSWWTARVIKAGAEISAQGAKIALDAQISDDKRDERLMLLFGSMLKARQEITQPTPQFPPLPSLRSLPAGEVESDDNVSEGYFTMTGLDDEKQ